MKNSWWTFAICVVCALSGHYLYGQPTELLLRDLTSEPEKYTGKKITMQLKLKYVDWLFGKAYFYDRKNYDIAFDISLQAEMDEYRYELLSLREGMDFEVTFLYQGVGNIGMIHGELVKFIPVILQKLPEGTDSNKHAK